MLLKHLLVGHEVTSVIASSSLERKRLILKTTISNCDSNKPISSYIVLKGTIIMPLEVPTMSWNIICDTNDLGVACNVYNKITQ